MDNKFKDIFKSLRMEKGIGQTVVAKELGVSKGLISLWENGLREPGMSSLIAISKYFGVSIDYLVGLKEY